MSAPRDKCPPPLAPLLSRMLDDRFSEADRQQLQTLLREDQAARRYYLRFMRTHALLQWSHGQPHIHPVAPDAMQPATAEPEQFHDHDDRDESLAHHLAQFDMATLVEALAPPEHELHKLRDITEDLERAEAERKRKEAEKKAREAAAYKEQGRRLGLDNKKPEDHDGIVIPYSAFYIGIAALLALALSLGLPMLRSLMEEEPRDVAEERQPQQPEQPESQQPVVIERPVVATLVRTLDAVWAERTVEVREGEGHRTAPLASGAKLREGDRYRLTGGFAEITTRRGAIAILEAPATIEFTDSDNAIQLHSGKLVGICETESSKGFVVRTPGARIIDIGTTFGVDVLADSTTQVQVYSGEVHAGSANVSAGEPSMVLLSNQAAIIRPNDQAERVAFESDRYQQAMAIARITQPDTLAKSAMLSDVHRHKAFPADLRHGKQEADALQVFLERQGVTLMDDLRTDLKQAGSSRNIVLPDGTTLDVYLLHFDPIDGAVETKYGSFTIHFDNKIIGINAYKETLIASEKRFKREGTLYPPRPSDTNALEQDGADRFTIGPDGQTLHLDLVIARSHIDQLRVLIMADDAGGE